MQAIVLVGGEGTRLRPLTDSIPKPALTLVDRPFLAYMIEWLAGYGVSEVVLACGFLPDVLRGALAGEEERTGAKIRYVSEPRPLGTAGAIRFAADALGDELEDRFLALNGDVLTDLDLKTLLDAHEARSARATLGLYPVEDSSAFGLVDRGEGGEVLEFLEKTGAREPGVINAGMYVLERSVLDPIPPGENVSIERDVFPRLVGEGLYGLPLDGYWLDIGTPERYMQASWDILEGRVATQVEPSSPGVLIDPGAEVEDGATVGPRAVIGPGCRLGPGAQVLESVLLDGCTVGANARVAGSILASGAVVAAGAQLSDAVVAADERVPS
ncbi:MAG TPA: NDP-sugar synthase [Solirubrobacterales bacterium]|nr:NDP-sugar synthase [Solirubrobacterales bacterium]